MERYPSPMLMLVTTPVPIVVAIKLAERLMRFSRPLSSTRTKPARSRIPPSDNAISASDIVHIILVMPPRLRRVSSCSTPVFAIYPVCRLFNTSVMVRSCVTTARNTAVATLASMLASAGVRLRLRTSNTINGKSVSGLIANSISSC